MVSNFPEKAKLDEIAKYSNFTITFLRLEEDGTLTPEAIKAACGQEAVPVRPQAQGIALLTSHLGDPSRPVLTTAQLLPWRIGPDWLGRQDRVRLPGNIWCLWAARLAWSGRF